MKSSFSLQVSSSFWDIQNNPMDVSTSPPLHPHFPQALSISRTWNFLWEDSVLGMADASPSSRLFLQPKSHRTVPPTVHWVQLSQGPVLSLPGDMQSWHLLFMFSNLGIWAEPFSETTCMTSLEAVLFSSLRVLFPFVLHTLSRVQCTWEVVWRSAGAGASVYSALCFPLVGYTLETRYHHPHFWTPFCWHYLLLNVLLIL